MSCCFLMRLSKASSLCKTVGVINIAPCRGWPMYECISLYGHIKLYVVGWRDVKVGNNTRVETQATPDFAQIDAYVNAQVQDARIPGWRWGLSTETRWHISMALAKLARQTEQSPHTHRFSLGSFRPWTGSPSSRRLMRGRAH